MFAPGTLRASGFPPGRRPAHAAAAGTAAGRGARTVRLLVSAARRARPPRRRRSRPIDVLDPSTAGPAAANGLDPATPRAATRAARAAFADDRPRRAPRAIAPVVALSVAALATLPILAMHLVERGLRGEAAARVEARAESIVERVDGLRHLAVALAGHPDVRALLAARRPVDDGIADRVNAYLAAVADASGASILYVIDAAGLTRAASNFRDEDTLVGNSYAWRPYFQEAMAGREARYYAIGATTGVAGYFFARPVTVGGDTSGVAVVKVELESVQRRWERGNEALLLVDDNGVAIAASDAGQRFRAVGPIDPARLAAFEAERKYADRPLEPLDASASVLEADRVRLDGASRLVVRAPIPDRGWTLVELLPTGPVRAAGALSALGVLLVAVLSGVALLYGRERARRAALDLEARDAVRVRGLNRQLEAEIAERRRTEAELDETQSELVQASKLAALGQMSAAVAHEVNQPLAAIRTYAASARLLLERGRGTEVCANLDEIEALTERLATVTSDLKVFARRSDDARDPVDLALCIERARAQLGPLLADTGTELRVRGPDSPVHALGSAVRVEQVISNLVRNAVDATAGNAGDRIVEVTLGVDGDEAVLRVADNGEGLDDAALEHLFDPFFTTKPVGQGVGLGLAIGYGIVQEMGGRLRVRNLDDGGALFSLRLARHVPEGDAP